MPNEKRGNKIIFSIYPNASGYGFVYMMNPRKLIDYGTIRILPICNKKVLSRIKKSLQHFQPYIVILQNPEGKSSRTGKRVKRLIKRIVKHAKENNLKVYQYSRDQIRSVFEEFNVVSKFEISQLLISEFKELKYRAPIPRKLWTCEDRNMAIFDSLSLALTHYYLSD